MSVWIVYKSVSKYGSFENDDPRPEKGSTQEDRFLSATSAETWNAQAPPSLGHESLRSGQNVAETALNRKPGTYCERGAIDQR